MSGHGCPTTLTCRLALAAAALCAYAALSSTATADDVNVRLRIAWGGGEARSWQGTIRLSAGKLLEPTPLGLEADSPGSMLLVDDQTVQIFPRTPRSYDGIDLRVQAPADAKLLMEIFAEDGPPPEPVEIPLARAIKSFQQYDLDERQNRLLAQRSPGDSLRVKLDRDSLVFAPGEKLELEVQPNALDLAAGTTYLLSVSLTAGRTDEEISHEDREWKAAAGAEQSPIPLSIPLPMIEGVYDLRIALYPKRLTTSLLRGKPIAERKVQVVAIDPVKPASPETQPDWKSIFDLDPANARWWDRALRLPSLRSIPNLTTNQLASSPLKTRQHQGRAWVELGGEGWQAYPLSITTPGLPHILEIEYPSDFEQTLGISLVEPNAAGEVAPIGLDSGVDVPAPAAGHKPQVRRHRLTFWPNTKTPYVLVVNRRAESTALFGKINVLAGPTELATMPVIRGGIVGRRLAAYWEKPLVPENFSAQEAIDPATGRTFDDWVTFYEAGTRMVETLQWAGYSAVVLSVACEGSAIYPSQRLGGSPRFDTGTFFESGQDPIRKDVLELILRLCDRAGIQVIPAVQFAAPLPELEKIRLLGGATAMGLEPIGPDGRTWVGRNGARRGIGVYYNALDERVQTEMQAVVAELAERYGDHASFGGVAVQCNAESYALLPDETCSYDDATIAHFEKDSGTSVRGAAGSSLDARAAVLHGDSEKAWLQWRATRLAGMYQRMQADLQTHRAGARLLLAPGDLLGSRQVQQALRPSLPPDENMADVLLMLGLDPAPLVESGIVLLRPQRLPAVGSPISRAFHDHWNHSEPTDTLFAPRGTAASMHYYEPASCRLPQFDAVSPFGPDKTRTWLLAQISPSAELSRRSLVHSIAALDSPLLVEGGWLLPLGQEEPRAEFAQLYRRLPAEPFVTVRPTDVGNKEGIVVRTLTRGEKTYYYIANDTPWQATVELDLSGASKEQITSYGPSRPGTNLAAEGAAWTVTLEPYDLAGGEIATAAARITDYRVIFASEVAESLKEQIRDVRLRANALRSPQSVQVLANPSFEAPAAEFNIPGWVFARGRGITVEVDRTQGYDGGRSLHIVSRAGADGQVAPVVWVRSDPFEPPATGRVSLLAWVRVANPAKQPRLRLAIEGKLDGRIYYRRGNIGQSEDAGPVKPLTDQWAMCRFPLPNLPLSGLTDLRVGFDLMGEGEVWIDQVQVFDLWFEDHERDELLKGIATADVQLRAGQLPACHRFVDGYWPTFLRQHVPLADSTLTAGGPQPAAVIAATPAAPSAQSAKAKKRAENTNMFERMRNWWPKSSSKASNNKSPSKVR